MRALYKVWFAPVAPLALALSLGVAGIARADQALLKEIAEAPDAGQLHVTVQTLVN